MRRLTRIIAAAIFGLLVGTAASQAQTQLIHPSTHVWRYLADNTDPGAAWFSEAFDDTLWPTGTGLFGNENNYPYPIGTMIAGPSTGGPPTVYFRTKFNYAGGLIGVVLTGTNYIDDGDVIYLNGVELGRFNMPAGPTTPGTFALGANPGGEPVLNRIQIPLDALTNLTPNPLRVGENLLAVEVHNNSAGSSDTAFTMALYSQQSVAPCTDGIQPTNRTVTACRNTTFTVVLPSNCGVPAPSIRWFRNVGAGDVEITGQIGISLTVSNLQTADQGEYFAVLNNGVGGDVQSRHAILTVTPDTQGPQIVSVVGVGGPNNEILVTYDEPVDDISATDAFQYTVMSQDGSHSVSVQTAQRDANNFAVVHLATDAPLNPALRYNYVIGLDGGIADACALNLSLNLTGPVLFQTILITADDVVHTWRYDDTGVDKGTDWKNVVYDDSGWKSGKGVFDGKDVARTVVSGLNIQTVLQRRIPGTSFETVNVPTMYFRTHINLAAGTAGVSVRTVADDGYVLYVNGVEVSRLRAPAANDGFATYSGGGTVGDGAYEGPVNIPTSLLNPGGDNVFAVLLKQNDPTSTDITWGLEVTAQVPGVTIVPVSIITQPASVTVTDGHVLTLSVVAAGTSPVFQWFKGTTPIPGATSATFTKVVTAADAGDYHVNVSNTANSVDSANATVTIRPVIVPYGATWRFEIASQDATLTGGTPWYAPGFDDSAWQSGPGPFGVDATAGTVARMPAPLATALPVPSATFLTAYFRTTVTVPALGAGQSLVLTHFIDDGAAIYVDGVLALRYNLTNDPPILSTDLAPGAVPGDGDAMLVSVPVTLSAGQHSIAVEVHQNSATSSDTVFGAELRAISGPAPSLTITQPTATSVLVTWTANPQYSLYQATAITGPFTAVGGNPQGSHPVASITGDAARYFQLRFNGQ